jgi:hypothetical protein
LKYVKPLLPTSPPLLHFKRELPSTSVESIIPGILNEPKKPESASTMMALACSRIKRRFGVESRVVEAVDLQW